MVPSFATQMVAPSKATATGAVPAPTVKVPSLAPLLAWSLVTSPLFSLATQISAPSKATPIGSLPTLKVPSLAPLAASLVTVLLCAFATQMLTLSKATPTGFVPTLKGFGWLAPYNASRPTWSGLKYLPEASPSDNFETVLLPPFVTQMLAPSKATPVGFVPTAKVPSIVPVLARSLVTL